MENPIRMNLTRSAYFKLFIALLCTTFVGAIIVRVYTEQTKNSILYQLYVREHPSVIDRLFRHVPTAYSDYIKIQIEQFRHGNLVCVEDRRFGFYVYKLFLTKDGGDLIDFNGGPLVSNDFLIRFDINAFNFYISNENKILNTTIVFDELLSILNHKCGEQEFYYINDQTDLLNILHLYPITKKQKSFNYNLLDYSNKYLIWNKRIGLVKLLVSFNADYTIKLIYFSKIGLLGNEMLNI